MSCGAGHRCGSALVLLWLWHRPAAATPVRSLAWELPNTVDDALKRKGKKKSERCKKEKKNKEKKLMLNSCTDDQKPKFGFEMV